LDRNETERLQRYLQGLFELSSLKVVPRPQKDDSAEVYKGDEFIGVLFRDEDDDDDDQSYSFQMAILGFDLDGI